jgi:hypothetical protein
MAAAGQQRAAGGFALGAKPYRIAFSQRDALPVKLSRIARFQFKFDFANR